jgi:hypothetical protein
MDIQKKITRRELLSGTAAAVAVALAGCAPQEKWPEIQEQPPTPPVVKPKPATNPAPTVVKPTTYSNMPWGWVPTVSERDWSAIIVHHSATESGNMAKFDVEHRQRGWEGVGYDFVIGNGTDSGDGEIEVTFRWLKQIQGAHTGGTVNNWANEEGIGICLVGDFNSSLPTSRQLQSLVKLVRFLQQRYRIPTNRIYGHGTTPGAHVTDCPGTRFPMARFKTML